MRLHFRWRSRRAAQVTLTSRAFRNTQLPLLLQELHQLTGYDGALPMNSGVEAVETAIKAARKWGYTVKGIPDDMAEIIVCASRPSACPFPSSFPSSVKDNFHGRTTTVVGFSSEPQYRSGFGPFAPGFVHVPMGDVDALRAAITPNTCAFLLEPVQGEAGILIPQPGYLSAAAAVCKANNVLLVCDEIQSGFGRSGKLFAYQHEEDVSPDIVIVGKALSGGVYPVSAILARREVLSVFHPGDHGSTYGGNPLACAVSRAALRVLVDEQLPERSARLGALALERLRAIRSPLVKEVRGIGLWLAIELHCAARPLCEKLKAVGVLCKETHDNVIRLAPPLVIKEDDLLWGLDHIEAVLCDRTSAAVRPPASPRGAPASPRATAL